MKPPRVPEVVSGLLVLATLACAMSESARATRMAETEEAQEIEALIQTSTAAALATDTPAPTATILIPPGMGFVPDLIGMDLDEAQRLLEQLLPGLVAVQHRNCGRRGWI